MGMDSRENSDFPSFHYPTQLNPHGRSRRLFADCGSFGGVNVSHSQQLDEELYVTSQYGHVQPHDQRLCASDPCLPLSSTPEYAQYPFCDRILDQIWKQKEIVDSFMVKFKLHRGCAKRMGEKREQLDSMLRELTKTHDSATQEYDEDRLFYKPPWFKRLLPLYEAARGIHHIPKVNSRYTGGCIKSLPSTGQSNNIQLVHVNGADFEKIKIDIVSIGENGRASVVQTYTTDTTKPLFEINTRAGPNHDLVAARGENTCSVWSFVQDGMDRSDQLGLTRVTDRDFTHQLSSVCLSPYVPGEILVADITGTASLWTIEGDRVQHVVQDKEPRFGCTDPWRSCEFTAHPRLVTFTDRTVTEIIDFRCPTSTSTCDLFALPNKHLHVRERIQVTLAHPSQSFYHFLATDYSIILIDERSITAGVLQWSHLLECLPQYMSIASDVIGPTPGHDLLVVGTQHPAQTECFQFLVNEDGCYRQWF